MVIKTLKALKAAVRVLPDVTMRKTEWGEVRVTLRQTAIIRIYGIETQDDIRAKAEELASYESDLEGAFGNAMALQEWATVQDALAKGRKL